MKTGLRTIKNVFIFIWIIIQIIIVLLSMGMGFLLTPLHIAWEIAGENSDAVYKKIDNISWAKKDK